MQLYNITQPFHKISYLFHQLKESAHCFVGSFYFIIEDYDVWDFELTDEEMAQMEALERNDRFADY